MSEYLVTIPIAGVMKVKVEAESAAEAEKEAKTKRLFDAAVVGSGVSLETSNYDDLWLSLKISLALGNPAKINKTLLASS